MLITTKQRKKYLDASDQTFQPSNRGETAGVAYSTKLLDVQIDENLTWKIQIRSITDKVSHAIRFLKHAKYFLPDVAVRCLYNSIVEPQVQYCSSVWCCCNSTDILKLQRLENRAACIMANSNFDTPSKSLIHSLGWKTIEQLINRQVNLMVLHTSIPLFLNMLATFCKKRR